MILNFDDFVINESKTSTKDVKRMLKGVLGRTDRAMLRKVLRHNIVIFKFVKRDGSLRTARGTLHPSYLPALKGGAPKPEHQFVYFDLEKKHWRSFRTFKFIKIVSIKPISSKITTKKGEELDKEDEEEMIKKHTKDTDLEKEETKKEKSKKIEKKMPEKESEKKHDESDEHKKTFKAGDKMSEKELMRRSSDFRKGTRKNKTTKKANDAFKEGKLKDIEGED